MTEVTRNTMLDDGGLFTTGTVIDKDFFDSIYDEIDDQCHSTNNLTIKPKTIIDEVVTARGSKASLDARLDVSLAEDGSLTTSFANVSGGLRVGFAGTTSADRIDLGDATFYLDIAAGGAGVPGIFFDTSDGITYDRAANSMSLAVGAATVLSLTSTMVATATGVQLGTANGSAAAPAITRAAGGAMGFFFTANEVVGVTTNGTERSRWTPEGVFNSYKGSDVVAAATITITGNLFHVTGNTNITSVSGTVAGAAVKAGTVVTIIFDGTPTFTDGSNLKLAGNLVASADDTITIVFDGTNWYEVCRSVN